jgi:hypothetical protein
LFIEIASKEQGQWISDWSRNQLCTKNKNKWIFPNEPVKVFVYILQNMNMKYGYFSSISSAFALCSVDNDDDDDGNDDGAF